MPINQGLVRVIKGVYRENSPQMWSIKSRVDSTGATVVLGGKRLIASGGDRCKRNATRCFWCGKWVIHCHWPRNVVLCMNELTSSNIRG